MTTAALFFEPTAYTTRGEKLMGRQSTGESFLRAFFQHTPPGDMVVQVSTPAHVGLFAEAAKAHGRQETIHGAFRGNLGALTHAGTLYVPGPNIASMAWGRALHGSSAWSLCGITYTLSSAEAMDAVTDLLTAPVEPWDALICISSVARDVVQRLWQVQAQFLQQRLGAQRFVMPQLPVIPLGIHTADFDISTAERARARQRFGVDANTHVVLFAGRLSFHAKAHPLAMYQALEHATAHLAPGERIVLIECGRHPNADVARAYATAAGVACPGVQVLALDGREADNYRQAWAAADVFCSLSDNIQETFGLTPIEAMACGLPVVVSDWDGYKDTVRDGIDGFRIPTLMPAAGMGADLAGRHALGVDNYDMYCGHTCSFVAVDVAAAARAFSRLFASPALRRQMGDAGRQRAREVFDWAVIMPRYLELWAQLGEIRAQRASGQQRARHHPWPARMDPFELFASFPSGALERTTVLALACPDAETAINRVRAFMQLDMVSFADALLPRIEAVEPLLRRCEAGPMTAVQIVDAVPAADQARAQRSLAWLLKLGVLRIAG